MTGSKSEILKIKRDKKYGDLLVIIHLGEGQRYFVT